MFVYVYLCLLERSLQSILRLVPDFCLLLTGE
eukprot:COSAG02_NODE_43851_length_371_cov_0.761029_1_plen_31_part_10